MSNCFIAYPDLTLDATVSGGGWTVMLPLANLKNSAMYIPIRSNDLVITSTTFDVDYGSAKLMRVIALLGHNSSPTGTVQVLLSNTADFSSTEYDTGTVNFWGDYSPLDAVMTTKRMISFPKQKFFVLPYVVSARYARVIVNDPANAALYFELSRFFVAPAWSPSRNMLYGVQFGYESSSIVDRSVNGIDFYDKRKSRRFCNFSLELPEDEILSYAYETLRELSITEELFFVYDSEAATMTEQLRSFIGTIRALSPLEVPYLDAGTAAYQLQEKL